MKRILFALFALGATLVAAPLASAKNGDRPDYVSRAETCEAILREFQADSTLRIPDSVLAKAKGIVIVNQFMGGFILGIKDGWGIAMVKRTNGQWSVPSFVRAGELSLGFQAGAKSAETILLLMDDQATQLLFKSRVNFGADAKAIAGPTEKDAEATTKILNASVLVYRRGAGLYAGATIKTGFLSPDRTGNTVFYSRDIGVPELLFSDWITPPEEVMPMVDYVQKITDEAQGRGQ